MYSITLKIRDIADKLQTALANVCLRWKATAETGEYIEARPTVYSYTYDDMDGETPLHTPCALVQCLSLDGSGNSAFVVHCAVCNPATQDMEKAADPDGDGIYHYSRSPRYTSAGTRSELYRATLLLAEYIFYSIQRLADDGEPISEIVLNTPSPYMESFPYCECTVTFNLTIAADIRGRNGSRLCEML